MIKLLKMFGFFCVMLCSLNAVAYEKTFVPAKGELYRSETGLSYRIIKKGHGKTPKANDEVEIRFVSYNQKGELFEGTLDKRSMILPIETAFSGLQQSLMTMSEGGVYEFYIPAALGFQEEGQRTRQPVTYRIELLRVLP